MIPFFSTKESIPDSLFMSNRMVYDRPLVFIFNVQYRTGPVDTWVFRKLFADPLDTVR